MNELSMGNFQFYEKPGKPTGVRKLNLTKPAPAGLKIGQRISRTMHRMS
jgi:hypothetical protein